jgi:putative membrane fusion protein
VVFFTTDKTTYKAEYDNLDLVSTYEGLVFRNENLVTSNFSGTAEYFISSGEKVKKGQKILRINSDGANNQLEVDSGEVSNSELSKIIKIDIEKLDEEIKALESKVYENKNTDNYKEFTSIKKDLILKIDKRKKIAQNHDLLKRGASSFKQTYIGSKNTQEGKSVEFYSPSSGIVTYEVDNFESILTLENIYSLDYDAIFESEISRKNLRGEYVKSGQSVYKVVDNSTWFIIANIKKDEINLYEKNKKIKMNLNGVELNAVVSDVFESDKHAVLVIKINEMYDEFYKDRVIDVSVIRENFQGVKIKRDSIVTIDGIQGVYVLGVDGRVNFRPIKILGNDNEYAIVKDNYITIVSDSEVTRVKTVMRNDEVIVNPVGISDGEVIN